MGGLAQQRRRDQRDAPLSTEWFPRPAIEADVELLQPAGPWTAGELFAKLADPTAVEWKHKVGVAGPFDGSAKPTTRLLAIGGWVMKTRLDLGCATAELAKETLLASRRAARAAGIWHPRKAWAIYRAGDAWYPLVLCPELSTLRTLADRGARFAAWTAMIERAIDVHRVHGLALDVNPSNFGVDAELDRTFYLDEETYAAFGPSEIAAAITARIPEEPECDAAVFGAWGRDLARMLAANAIALDAVEAGIVAYPLVEAHEPKRRAVVAAFFAARAERAREARKPAVTAELTCVLADVHGNLPALEAVLAEARRQGATRWLFLGDAVGYGPFPKECVERLAELGDRLVGIRGNHDHALATGIDVAMNSLARVCAEWTRTVLGTAELAWLGGLPTDHAEEGWLAVHGAPKDPQRFLAYVYDLTYEDNLEHLRRSRTPICFHGHTHVQLVHVELAGGASKLAGERTVELNRKHTWLVNPGSVGQPRDGDPRAAYALWNQRTGELRSLRVAYDLERTLAAVRAADLPSRLETRLQAGN